MNKSWPKYFRDRLWLGDDDGFVGIATLWTPTEIYSLQVDEELKKKIAVIGQLHTKRGVEYIFRNLWLNPKVSTIVVCGQDGCGAGDELVGFSKTGKTRSAFFDQVDKKYIEEFCQGVKVIDLRGKSVDEVIKRVAVLKKGKVFSDEIHEFDQVEEKASCQSENSVFRVEARTIGEGWLQVLKLISKYGRKIPRIYVYGGFEKMLLNMTVVITEEDISNPKMWDFFQFNKEDLKNYFKNFFTPNRGEEAYTYGERMFAYEADGKKIDQVTLMAQKMRSFEHNKGAVVVLWQPHIDNFPIRKPWRTPCLTMIQGMCLEGKFLMTAYFRSNDMFGAWPLNAMALRKMQTEVAKKIGKEVGDLTIISNCAFVDEQDMGEVNKIIDDNKMMFCRFDPRGNLLIETKGKRIIVKHTTSQGGTIKEYGVEIGKDGVRKLMDELISEDVISRVDHGLDIGIQLARAEMAIKLGLKFEQDKEVG